MQFRRLLYPFSILYRGVTTIRNKLFDWEILTSKSYNLPIISVGNITVGGTGKTPLTEYIIRLLKDNNQITLLSRGYKRQTKGALLADNSSNAQSIGDEPFQIKQKFPEINIVVAEKRTEGMDIILKNTPSDVVLMDDAYQHRYVTPGFSILVIDFNRPLWKDCVFPAGDLRETKRGQKRADVIVVNKCPKDLSESDQQLWLDKIRPLPTQKVFFTTITYGEALPMLKDKNEDFPKNLPVIGLAGIAQPQPFFNYLKDRFKVKEYVTFPDHHNFSQEDINDIQQKIEYYSAKALVTTEKDAVRLSNLPDELKHFTWHIPIQLKILFNQQQQFEDIINNYVRKNKSNSRLS